MGDVNIAISVLIMALTIMSLKLFLRQVSFILYVKSKLVIELLGKIPCQCILIVTNHTHE